jgi:hypothetical protein
VHALRTTVATVLALFLARIVGLPEPYWAVIGTMIVTQSTLVSALPISGQLIAATILGGTIGAMLTSYLGSSIVAFAVGILGLGLVCASLHFDKAAYRFAGITLAIVIFANTGSLHFQCSCRPESFRSWDVHQEASHPVRRAWIGHEGCSPRRMECCIWSTGLRQDRIDDTIPNGRCRAFAAKRLHGTAQGFNPGSGG